MPVLDVGAARGRGSAGCAARALPVPLHLARSLATLPPPLARRARRASAAPPSRSRRLDPADPALDGRTSAAGWPRTASRPRAVEALWDLVGVATLNATAGDASLGLAAMVFKTGLLSDPGAADIGWARVPLGDLHDTLARKALDSAGRPYRAAHPRHLHLPHEDGRLAAFDGSPARRSTPTPSCSPCRSARPTICCPTGALDAPDRLLEIGTAPILNVHVVYDRKVLRRPFFAALGSPVQWVFDRTEASGLPTSGQYLALSQSAAQDEIDEPVAGAARALSARAGAAAARAPAAPRSGTSSSPGSAPRRSPPPPASDGCGPAPAPEHPASTWPERGPPPGGPRPWRARSAAALSAAHAALERPRPAPRPPLGSEEAA